MKPSRRLLMAALLAASCAAGAQLLTPDSMWQEDAVPPAPEYDVHRLIEIETPPSSSVRMGIDPESIRLNQDTGVVRYVVVSIGVSAQNASYEGIRCRTAQYRVYARQVQDGDWQYDEDSPWREMFGQGGIRIRHPAQLARNGLCLGPAPRASVREMVQELRSGNASLYH